MTMATEPHGASTTADALTEYPQLAPLLDMAQSGAWIFIHTRGGDGALTEVRGIRMWPMQVQADAVAIRDLSDAFAVRTDQYCQLWRRGPAPLDEVIEALLELPAPDAPRAPRLALGSAPRLWTPRSAL